MADNPRGGIEFELGNFTKENIKVRNSVFIGMTYAYNSTLSNSKLTGLTTPRSGSTELENLRFYAFPTSTVALAICSKCDTSAKYTNLGTELFVSGLTFE